MSQRRFPFAAPLLLLAASLSPLAAEELLLSSAPVPDLSLPHPFGIHDMVRMERVGAPQPSPDGKCVAFTVRNWDPATNKVTTNLWLARLDGSPAKRLTYAIGQADTSPTWAPDSRTLAFVTGRSGSRQLWTISIDGGEARQLTSLPIDVDNPKWSSTGDYIAFSAEVYPDSDPAATAKLDAEKAADPVQAMKFDSLFIRHWDAFEDGKRSHLFVLPVKADESTGVWQSAGEPLDLMKGVDADCPTKPFGGAEDYDWSPDGKELAYVAQLGEDIAWSTDLNIYLVPVGGGEAKNLTEGNKASDTGPVYSPDGKTLAYRAMARPGFESDRYRIKLFDRTSQETRSLADDWDRSPNSIVWTPNSRSIVVGAAEAARQKLFAIDVTGGKPRVLVGEHYNSGAATLGNRAQIVFAQDSLLSPAEIYTAEIDGSNVKQLTHFNDERVKLAQFGEPSEFRFAGALGEEVQAWLIKPVGWQEGKKYPVALIVHGGPQGAIDDHFHYRWNPQAYAGAGYAVIAINFHGSTGFGQAFTDSISGDWGGKPFEDLMKGLDFALAEYPWLDGDRVAALGASYGGWMINWINGHTNRFKCLVNHDGGFDEISSYFTTEELWFPEWEFKGTPWTNRELYEKFSPSRYVDRWQTPTLVIHGALDYRLVDAEGIATFTALQRRGIPSQFLYFPDENHWVLKAKNSILWHETVFAWLEKWVGE